MRRIWLRHTTDSSHSSQQRRRQPGQVLVLFALASIPIMGFVGLSIDGGNILAQRRIAQNGADAGALAGARDMMASLPNGGGPLSGEPFTTARKYAEENAKSGNQLELTVTPEYINNSGTVVYDKTTANGLRVTVTKRFPTYFISVLGISDFTVSAVAAGKIQRWPGGYGPFVVCSDGLKADLGSDKTHEDPDDFLPGGLLNFGTDPPTVRPEAMGQDFFVHGPPVGQNDGDCGWEPSGSNFKGNGKEAQTTLCTSTPCWFDYTNGTDVGKIEVHVAALPGCEGLPETYTDGCVAILPVSVRKGSTYDTCGSPAPPSAECVRAWVPFQLKKGTGSSCGSDGSCHIGRIVNTVLLTSAPGVDCTPPCSGPLVVKLTQ